MSRQYNLVNLQLGDCFFELGDARSGGCVDRVEFSPSVETLQKQDVESLGIFFIAVRVELLEDLSTFCLDIWLILTY